MSLNVVEVAVFDIFKINHIKSELKSCIVMIYITDLCM